MKAILALGLLTLCGAGCSTPRMAQSNDGLLPSLRPYVDEVAGDLDAVPAERKVVLDEIAGTIATRLKEGGEANLTFICTHNSRRSHLAQIWAQVAARYYGLEGVKTFSGGTEATACNIRTVRALRRAGFSVVDSTGGENPVYLVQYAEGAPPMRASSSPPTPAATCR